MINYLLDKIELIIRLSIEFTPLDYFLGMLEDEEPWNGIKRFYED